MNDASFKETSPQIS